MMLWMKNWALIVPQGTDCVGLGMFPLFLKTIRVINHNSCLLFPIKVMMILMISLTHHQVRLKKRLILCLLVLPSHVFFKSENIIRRNKNCQCTILLLLLDHLMLLFIFNLKLKQKILCMRNEFSF